MTEVFDRETLKNIIRGFAIAFQMSSTPQGESYWKDIVVQLEAIRDEGHTHKGDCERCGVLITKPWQAPA